MRHGYCDRGVEDQESNEDKISLILNYIKFSTNARSVFCRLTFKENERENSRRYGEIGLSKQSMSLFYRENSKIYKLSH